MAAEHCAGFSSTNVGDDKCVLQFESRILDLGRIPYVGFRFHLELQNLASFLKSIHVVQSKRM